MGIPQKRGEFICHNARFVVLLHKVIPKMKTRHHLWAAILFIITLLAACKDENPFDKYFVQRNTFLTVPPAELSLSIDSGYAFVSGNYRGDGRSVRPVLRN